MFDILSSKCEKCGSKDNVMEDKVLGRYRAKLCLKCWRAWEYLLLQNPDYQALIAVGQKYSDSDGKEKEELLKLNNSITIELYPVLEKWISHSN